MQLWERPQKKKKKRDNPVSKKYDTTTTNEVPMFWVNQLTCADSSGLMEVVQSQHS